jgi:hypothetical protein
MQAPMVSEMFGEACPASAPFFGYMGAAAALIFASACPVLHFLHACRRFGLLLSPQFLPVILQRRRVNEGASVPSRQGQTARHHGWRM